MSQSQEASLQEPTCTENSLEMQSKSQNSSSRETHKRRDAKRQQWEAKQARLLEEQNKTSAREIWIRQHEHCCTKVSLDDVKRIKKSSESSSSSSCNDDFLASLLRPYIDLKDGPKRMDNDDEETLFIAEGTETVRLLIQQTAKQEDALTVKSIFVKPATLFDPPVQLLNDVSRVLSSLSSRKRPREKNQTEDRTCPFHVLVGTPEAMSALAGFAISRGALACGVVPKRNEAWLHGYLSQRNASPLRLLALDGISDTANMGSMIRCAAAFGIHAIILSRDCCDAWYRRSVRVSMGYIFQVPVVRVGDLAGTLRNLAAAKSCVSFAAVIDRDDDVLVLEDMTRGAVVPSSWCCVMGNEGNGISKPVVEACSHKLRIKMYEAVDSLSVPVATGILLHGLREREARDIE